MVDKIQGLNLTNETNVESIQHVKNVEGSASKMANHAKNANSELNVHTKKAFEELAKKLEEFKKVVKTSFKYEILKNPDMIVLKIVNDDNGEVIRQIPPKEAVRLAKAIDELLGLFVDKHV